MGILWDTQKTTGKRWEHMGYAMGTRGHARGTRGRARNTRRRAGDTRRRAGDTRGYALLHLFDEHMGWKGRMDGTGTRHLVHEKYLRSSFVCCFRNCTATGYRLINVP